MEEKNFCSSHFACQNFFEKQETKKHIKRLRIGRAIRKVFIFYVMLKLKRLKKWKMMEVNTN